MLIECKITSKKNTEFIDITRTITKKIEKTNIKSGTCCIFIPHTTAAVTVNENADPAVKEDMLMELNKLIPFEDGYKHLEGNSAAHIKASIMGFNETLILDNGKLVLGTWQGIYFAEFDGPRERKIYVKLMEG
ncbi:secondary thiamine-phosphate synthase enzyme YjbQ [Proteinivorax tanatarense]|uniref:Secondary thiamine-phosphate synthase enzyme YjbQ n=1 Tax=Proteinivorax tanatarense TaxID=1260629 RepID=A0AAU7VJ52_9FIRM